MDFDQLITFLEVARQGSFSRAGEKVFRSQSAVSAQIRQLEQEYGDRLLDRSGKTVKLTPAGQVFFSTKPLVTGLKPISIVRRRQLSPDLSASRSQAPRSPSLTTA